MVELIKITNDLDTKLHLLSKLEGYTDGLMWANVIDTDEYTELNKMITDMMFESPA